MAVKTPNKIDFDDEILVEQPKTLLSRSKLVVLVTTILAIIGGTVYYLDKKKITWPWHASTVATDKQNTVSFYDLEEFQVNLANTEQMAGCQVLKLALTLQLANAEDMEFIKTKLPLVRDKIMIFLKELRLSDITGSGGTIMIKTELLKRINKVLTPLIVQDVLFREFIIT